MKLTCAGTKKSPAYYIQKSVRIGNKTTTKTVERLGSIEEIKARCGDMDPIEWAKEYTKRNQNMMVSMPYVQIRIMMRQKSSGSIRKAGRSKNAFGS